MYYDRSRVRPKRATQKAEVEIHERNEAMDRLPVLANRVAPLDLKRNIAWAHEHYACNDPPRGQQICEDDWVGCFILQTRERAFVVSHIL